MYYRVGLPLWRTLARRGVPLRFRVYVAKDEEAGVYIAHSPDVHGLNVEAATLDELNAEIQGAASELLNLSVEGDVQPPMPSLLMSRAVPCGV